MIIIFDIIISFFSIRLFCYEIYDGNFQMDTGE